MPTLPQQIDDLKRQLAQLNELASQGVLSAEAVAPARADIERAIIDAVRAHGSGATPAAPAVPGASPARPPRRLVGAVTAFVLVFGLAGYAWRGNHEGLSIGPGEGVAAAEGEQLHGPTDEQIAAMVDRLVERLKTQPEDAGGWAMLGRTYAALNRHAEAVGAYRKVVALRPTDAQALADLADGIAVTNNRNLEGEPEKLIMQALALDPKNLKALALAGTVAFNHDDHKAAIDYWQRAVDASDPASDFTRQLEGALADARQRAGMPAVAVAAPPPAASAPGGAVAAAAGNVSGRISLAPALKSKVAAGDTVFIFARPASGSRMPLAILRKQVSELPFDFTLDDSMAMSPAARLSSSAQVVVGARISKSGNAMPQPGDLQVLSEPVAVGTRGLTLVIAETVR